MEKVFELDKFTSLGKLLEKLASQVPDNLALVSLGNGRDVTDSLTYSQLYLRAARGAALLREHLSRGIQGFQPKAVVFCEEIVTEDLARMFACWLAGLCVIPLPFDVDPAYLRMVMEACQIGFCLGSGEVLGKLQQEMAAVVALDSDEWAGAGCEKKLDKAWASFEAAEVPADDLAMILYTSGSTSKPRGVKLAHRILGPSFKTWVTKLNMDSHDVVLGWLSLTHGAGLVFQSLAPMTVACPVYVIPTARYRDDPSRWIQAISLYGITNSLSVGSSYRLAAEIFSPEEVAGLNLERWRAAINIGEPVTKATLDEFARKFEPAGFKRSALYCSWGLSEAGCIVTVGQVFPDEEPAQEEDYDCGVGSLIMDAYIGLSASGAGAEGGVFVQGDCADGYVEEEAISLARLEAGEIGDPQAQGLARWGLGSNTVFIEADAWAEIVKSGLVAEAPCQRAGRPSRPWGGERALFTGDLGVVEGGNLHLVGRCREMAIIGGRNIHHTDVYELIAASHPLLQGISTLSKGEASRMGQGRFGCILTVSEKGQDRLVVLWEVPAASDAEIEEAKACARRAVAESLQVELSELLLLEQGTLPRTALGKLRLGECSRLYKTWVDQGQLPLGGGEQEVERSQAEMRGAESWSLQQWQEWILNWASRRLKAEVSSLNVKQSFLQMGMSSLMIVDWAVQLGRLLGCRLPASFIWKYPTAEKLAGALLDRQYDLNKRADSPGRSEPWPARLGERAGDGRQEAIAVVGMACHFPGGIHNTEQLWELLTEGRSTQEPLPLKRRILAGAGPWLQDDLWGNYLEDVEMFPAEFFDISRGEAESMDPQQRWTLVEAALALADAGLLNERGEWTVDPGLKLQAGIFMGSSIGNYAQMCRQRNYFTSWTQTGQLPGGLAGRVSFTFDWGGPALTVSTACSSSLLSVHLACNSLWRGECRLALAGGVMFNIDPAGTISMRSLGLANESGITRTFDSDAAGFGASEGCAVVALMPVSLARQYGLRIWALLRGSACTQDGQSADFTSPNPRAQTRAIKEALRQAGLKPAQISYLEAHGASTPLGDPIELEAAAEAYGPSRVAPLYCGAVKTNLGHTYDVAGVAGLIKTVLCLYHRRLVPSLNVSNETPGLSSTVCPMALVRRCQDWVPAEPGAPLRAGVSSFGMIGTNVHVVLEEAPAQAARPAPASQVTQKLAENMRRVAGEYWLPVEQLIWARQVESRLVGQLPESREIASGGLQATVVTLPPLAEISDLAGDLLGLRARLQQAEQEGRQAVWLVAGRNLADEEAFAPRWQALLSWCRAWRTENSACVLRCLNARAAQDDESIRELMRGAQAAKKQPAYAFLEGEDEFELVGRSVYSPRLLPYREEKTADRTWPVRWKLDADSVYVITGGTGGLGLALAQHLVERGARHLCLLARRPQVSFRQIKESILDRGVDLSLESVDVCDAQAVERFFADFSPCGQEADTSRRGVLGGIFHLAGSLEARFIAQEDYRNDYVAEVLGGKALGAWHLCRVAQRLHPRYLVFFSSVAAFLPCPGQSAYAAANGFLNGVTSWAKEHGLPACCLAWNGISDAGSLSRRPALLSSVREAGLGTLSKAVAGVCLEEVLSHRSGAGQVLLLGELNSRLWLRTFPRWRVSSLGRGIGEEAAAMPAGQTASCEELRGAGATACPDACEVRDLLRRILGFERWESAADEEQGGTAWQNRRLGEMGLDSLAAVELRNALQRRTGLDLPVTLAFEHPSIASIVDYLRQALLGSCSESGSAPEGADQDNPCSHALNHPEGGTRLPIAVVGLGLRVRGSEDPESFGRLLKEGYDGVGPCGRPREQAGEGCRSGKYPGSYLDDVAGFDYGYFALSPSEAAYCDPQHRLLLEVAVHALQDAGFDPQAWREGRAGLPRLGIFIGLCNDDYAVMARSQGKYSAWSVLGSQNSGAAGRLAYFLGTDGPALTVDTACSSSLTALHLAKESLLRGECDIALAGGVNLILNDEGYRMLESIGALSAQGCCATFSSKADGFVRGEGGGLAVLMPAERARRQGRRVRALMLGSAMTQDGHSAVMSAPSGRAQEQAVSLALREAALRPAQISFVEAHGTGTPLGDIVELRALQAALAAGEREHGPLYLSALKSNWGHTEGAAGILGFIKLVLSLEQRWLFPSLHCEELNPHFDWQGLEVVRAAGGRAWPQEAPLNGGVSAFGITGTNVHIVLSACQEEFPIEHRPLELQKFRRLPCWLQPQPSEGERELSYVLSQWRPCMPPEAAPPCAEEARGEHPSLVLISHLPLEGTAQSAGIMSRLLEAIHRLVEEDRRGESRSSPWRVLFLAPSLYPHGDFPGALEAESCWGLALSALREYPYLKLLLVRCEDCCTLAGDAAGAMNGWVGRCARYAAASGERSFLIRDGQMWVRRWLKSALPKPALPVGGTPKDALAPSSAPGSRILISGAFGGLGRQLALRLLRRGWEVWLASYRQLNDEEEDWFRNLPAEKARLLVYSHPEDLWRTCREQNLHFERFYHLAALNVEGLVGDLQLSDIERACAAKHGLLQALVGEVVDGKALSAEYRPPVSHCVVYGAISGVWGNAGQGAYAAADAGVRAFKDWCADLDIACTLINWGPWSLGLLDRYTPVHRRRLLELGLGILSPGEALRLLDNLLARPEPVEDYQIILRCNWEHLTECQAFDRSFEELSERSKSVQRELAQMGNLGTLSAGSASALPASRPSSRDWTALIWSTVEHILAGGSLPKNFEASFVELGLDSLMCIELRNLLSAQAGRLLPATLAFDYPTTKRLARYLDSLDATASSAQEGPVPKPISPVRLPSPTAPALVADQEVRGAVQAEAAAYEPVAVIGMACRLPGGISTPEEFWQCLVSGKDVITTPPANRWDVSAWPADKPGREGGFLADAEQFDPAFFGISPREALDTDPQQRLLLETAWRALEDAFIPAHTLEDSDTGVFVGLCTGDFEVLVRRAQAIEARTTPGVSASVAAGRLAYTLGLQGPALVIDTACSSSLVAVHQACYSLQRGECSLALAGGVNLMLDPQTHAMMAEMQALSPRSRCYVFDDSADGYVRSEGCGILVLKPLARAQRDGDRILGVIRASAVAQDGRSNGLTAPNGQAQEKVMRRALRVGGLAPGQVSYVEAHGVATSLGDPIELNSIDSVYGGADRLEPLPVGSLKSNIGHTEGAAGAIALIKCLLMLRHRQIPGNLHFEKPNTKVDWERLHLRVPVGAPGRLAASQAGSPLYLAVNGFGLAGTNAHVIISETDSSLTVSASGKDDNTTMYQVAWACKEKQDMAVQLASLGQVLEDCPKENWPACLNLLSAGAQNWPWRLSFSYSVSDPLAFRQELLRQEPAPVQGEPVCAWLFTGQGSRYPGMAAALYKAYPAFAQAVDRCLQLADPAGEISLRLVLLAQGSEECQRAEELLASPLCAQLCIFILEYALGQLWNSWGVYPQYVLGHSLGEYAAAVQAGLLPLEAAVRLVKARASVQQQLPSGGMVAVWAGEQKTRALIQGRDLVLAALNSPMNSTVSGPVEAIESFCAHLRESKVHFTRLEVNGSGHSPQLRKHLPAFSGVARSLNWDPAPAGLGVGFVSALWGRLAEASEVASPSYWEQQLVEPVRFAEGMSALRSLGVNCCLELGPQPALSAMGAVCLLGQPVTFLPSLRPGTSPLDIMRQSAGKLWAQGFPVNWRALLPSPAALLAQMPDSGPKLAEALPKAVWHRSPFLWPLAGHPDVLAEPSPAAKAVTASAQAAPLIPWGMWHYAWENVVNAQEVSNLATADIVDNASMPRRRWLSFSALKDNAAAMEALAAYGLEISSHSLESMAEALAAPGPVGLVQLCLRDTPDALFGPYWELFDLVSRLAQCPDAEERDILLLVLSDNTESDAEGDLASASALRALLRSAQVEFPYLRTAFVDCPLRSTAPQEDRDLTGAYLRALSLSASALADLRVAGCSGRLLALLNEDEVRISRGYCQALRLVPAEENCGADLKSVGAEAGAVSWSSSGGTYLITGGTGGLGRRLCRWLARRGAGRLLLLSRHPQLDEDTEACLAEHNCRVELIACSVASGLDVFKALMPYRGEKWEGVFHLAGKADLDLWRNQDKERLYELMEPKGEGLMVLHNALDALAVTYPALVCFSSIASVAPSPGQCTYAAANGACDGFATSLASQGQPVLCLNWSLFAEAGMSARDERGLERLERCGLLPIVPEQGFEAMGRLLKALTSGTERAASGIGPLVLGPVDWSRFLAYFPVWRSKSLLRHFQTDTVQQGSLTETAPVGIGELLRRTVAQALGYAADKVLPTQTPFLELGLDSLMAVEVANALSSALGQKLPVTMVFDYPTLEKCGAYLQSRQTAELASMNSDEVADAPLKDVCAYRTCARSEDLSAVAIVGMGCRFPGADSIEEYWEMLLEGREVITPVPRERFDAADIMARYPEIEPERLCRYGGFVDIESGFDPALFGISPAEAQSMDPHQKLLLPTVRQALEDAGLGAAAAVQERSLGIFVGQSNLDYALSRQDGAGVSPWSATGAMPSFMAGRLAYLLGVHGPALVVDTACSSSLVALHLALRSLRTGECELALVAGVNAVLAPEAHAYFSLVGGYALDGHCRVFDARAQGMLRSDGCGALLLKPLQQARHDGDHIWAVVRGSAVNQDGKSASLTAPNGPAQEEVMRAALRDAHLEPGAVSYVEAHGTGTPLGDPMELLAMGNVYGSAHSAASPLYTGSVKSNMGHCEGAAGAAGLIKAALCLERGLLVPSLHFEEPCPYVDFEALHLRVPTELQSWPPDAAPALAGVSAFGMSGTNAHVLLSYE